MNSQTVVIIANGQFPTHPVALEILNSADNIICCDGAADALLKNTNLKPDVIIGDLDSVSENTKKLFSDKIIQINGQNTNDLTKAFEYAKQKKYKKIIFMGTSGGREDHAISNFYLLMNFSKQSDIEIYTDHGKFISVRGQQKINSFPGQPVSFFTENSDVVVNCKNLKWPLIHKKLEFGWQGSLNESVGDELDIEVMSGGCLVFFAHRPV